MKRLRIYVTAKDLREGTPRNSSECPVARAVDRAIGRVFGGHRTVTAGFLTTIVRRDVSDPDHTFVATEIRHWRHSQALENYVVDIDTGRPVKPASFILTAEAPSHA